MSNDKVFFSYFGLISKLCEPIQEGVGISKKVQQYLGSDNFNNIYSFDNQSDAELFFEVFLNAILIKNSEVNNWLLQQFAPSQNGVIRVYPNQRLIFTSYSYPWDKDYFYKDDFVSQQGQGTIFEIMRYYKNIPKKDAINIVSEALGISFKNIFYYDDIILEDLQHSHLKSDYILKKFRDPLWSADTPSIVLEKYSEVHGNNGYPISLFLLYKWGERSFCLPAPIDHGICELGIYMPKAHFFNEHLFEFYSTSPIIYFQDIRVALTISNLLDNLEYDRRKFIITSSIGYDLDKFKWNYFRNHNVIFVPSPSTHCLSSVKVWKDKLESISPKFSVSKKFVLRDLKSQSSDYPQNINNVESYIVDNSLFLRSHTDVLDMINEIIDSSTSYKYFKKRFIKLGLFQHDNNDNTNLMQTFASTKIDPRLIPSRADTLAQVTANHIIRPQSLIMVSGLKNVGKTHISYLLVRCALQIENIIPIFNNYSPASLGNVAIVDGETPFDELKSNINKHGLEPYLQNKLFIYSRLNDNCELPPSFDITDQEFRLELTNSLIENNCKLLILDNLTALMGSKIDNATNVQSVINWAQELQKQGMCIIFIAHKSVYANALDKDRNRGSRILKDRARIIINLLGADEIKGSKEYEKGFPNAIVPYLTGDNTLVGLNFTTLKTAPPLEGHTLWLTLPKDSTWQYIALTNKRNNQIPLSELQPQDPLTELTQRYPALQNIIFSLSHKHQQILCTLHQLGGESSIGPIAAHFSQQKGYGKDTIRNILKFLGENHTIRIVGSGRSQRYKIVDS